MDTACFCSLLDGEGFLNAKSSTNSLLNKWHKRPSLITNVPIYLKLSPENINIVGLRQKHNAVSSWLGPQRLQEQITNYKVLYLAFCFQ